MASTTRAGTGCGTCRERLRELIVRGHSDVTSANIFESVLADEERHVDYLETQLGLIEQLGEPLYLAQLVEQPSD